MKSNNWMGIYLIFYLMRVRQPRAEIEHNMGNSYFREGARKSQCDRIWRDFLWTTNTSVRPVWV